MSDDRELLQQYVKGGSEGEGAFTELVSRHLPLVYSAALRQVGGDEALAKDVAQSVFIDLARKAASVLRRGPLPGWLYTSTRFAAAKALRSDRRRKAREEAAMSMQDLSGHNPTPPDWDRIGPILDEAMSELNAEDQNAVLLRFFQGKEHREVGAVLGISEDAARMRVARALGKLEAILARRGVTLSAGVLGTALGSEAVGVVPGGLATAIAGSALVQAQAAGGIGIGLMEAISMSKMKIAIGALVFASVVAPVWMQQARIKALGAENTELRQRVTETEKGSAVLVSPLVASTVQAKQAASESGEATADRSELLRLRGEVARLRQNETRLAEWEARMLREAQIKESANDVLFALRQIGYACRVYATDHNNQWPASFAQIQSILRPEVNSSLKLERFEFVSYSRTLDGTMPNLLLAREREPRSLPDGRWARAYLYVDGNAVQRISENGDFARLEKQAMEQAGFRDVDVAR